MPTCDICGLEILAGDDPLHELTEIRTQRPSDPSDMSCILIAHRSCNPETNPRNPQQWDEWIETEGAALGYVFLS